MFQISTISVFLAFATGNAFRSGLSHGYQVHHTRDSSSSSVLQMTVRTDEINRWITAQGAVSIHRISFTGLNVDDIVSSYFQTGFVEYCCAVAQLDKYSVDLRSLEIQLLTNRSIFALFTIQSNGICITLGSVVMSNESHANESTSNMP